MEIALVVILAFLVYPVGPYVCLRAVRPVRMKMADTARRILSSPDYTEEEKQLVSEMLDDAFDWTLMIRMSLSFPIFAFEVLRNSPDTETDLLISKEDGRAFVNQHIWSTMAANPLFTVVFLFEALLFAVLIGTIAIIAALVGKGVQGLAAATNAVFVASSRATFAMAPNIGRGLDRI